MRIHLPASLETAAILVLAALLSAGAAGVALAADDLPVDEPPGGETLSMARFYPGNLTKTGEFPGKLICLPAAKAGLTAGAEECGEQRYFALSMQGGALVHPLIPGSQEVLDFMEAKDLLGKEVEVHGKHYSSTGMILVDDIREPDE